MASTSSPLPYIVGDSIPVDYEYEDASTTTDSILNNSYVKLAFMLVYVAVFLSTFIGNLLVLLVITFISSFRTMRNIFLANLAVADLLVGIFCLIPNGVHFFSAEHGIWHFGKVMCHLYVSLLNMLPNVSAGILVLMSIERYIAVTRPMVVHSMLTKRLLCISAGFVWILSFLMNLPYYKASQYISFQDVNGEISTICTREHYYEFGFNMLQITTVVNGIVWFGVPFFILIYIYLTIGFVTYRSTRNNAVARSSQGSSARSALLNRKTRSSTDSGRYPVTSEAIENRRRIGPLVVVFVVAFGLLSLPRYLYLTWSVFRTANEPRCLNCLLALIQPVTFLLMFINSGINPILYALISTRFRTAIKKSLSKILAILSFNKHEKQIGMHLPLRHKTRDSDHVVRGRAFPLPKRNMLQTTHGVYTAYSPSDSPIETVLLA